MGGGVCETVLLEFHAIFPQFQVTFNAANAVAPMSALRVIPSVKEEGVLNPAGGADRVFYKAVSKALPSFGCTGEATVNYTAPDRLLNMFKEGNEVMKKAYVNLPWRK